MEKVLLLAVFTNRENSIFLKEDNDMKKRVVAVVMAAALAAGMTAMAGCGQKAADTASNAADAVVSAAEEAKEDLSEAAEEVADAIDPVAEVDGLIEDIQVQEWTEETTAQCAAAKAAYDALTDEQKEQLEDPDYFGLDTGDASADDPLNQDEIGENELLVVSFGTSFNESRVTDIGGVEKALAEAYPEWSVRRAFTAQIIINHILARDGEEIDNVEQALQRAIDNEVKNLVIQPTHLMHGAEYDELVAAVDAVRDQFESVEIAEPLMGTVGADISEINADKETAAKAMVEEAVSVAGAESVDALAEAGTAIVFMGHGTSHEANITYDQMQTQMEQLGYKNVFIGTVEGEPEDTECSVVIDKVKDAGYTNVILRPMMVVAGDHANNDMAGEDEDSWVSMFNASGNFESVDTQIQGLGRIQAIEQMYVEHTGAVIQ